MTALPQPVHTLSRPSLADLISCPHCLFQVAILSSPLLSSSLFFNILIFHYCGENICEYVYREVYYLNHLRCVIQGHLLRLLTSAATATI